MTTQSKRWTFTKNNHGTTKEALKEWVESIKEDKKVGYFVAGFEVAPQTGTLHLQGYVEWTVRRKLSTIKNLLKDTLLDGAHWEKSKGTAEQNLSYCSKEDEDPVLVGSPQATQGQRMDVASLLERVQAGDSDLELAAAYPHAHARFSKYCEMMRAKYRAAAARKEREEEYEGAVLRTWQAQVLQALETQNRRKVAWVWEATGETGKSWMAMYLLVKKKGFLTTGGALKDQIYAFKNAGTPEWVIVDLTRGQEDKAPYRFLEQAKNGFMMNTKYEAQELYFRPCKVIVFANFEPDRTKMSEDRWDVHHIAQTGQPPAPPAPAQQDEDDIDLRQY